MFGDFSLRHTPLTKLNRSCPPLLPPPAAYAAPPHAFHYGSQPRAQASHPPAHYSQPPAQKPRADATISSQSTVKPVPRAEQNRELTALVPASLRIKREAADAKARPLAPAAPLFYRPACRVRGSSLTATNARSSLQAPMKPRALAVPKPTVGPAPPGAAGASGAPPRPAAAADESYLAFLEDMKELGAF